MAASAMASSKESHFFTIWCCFFIKVYAMHQQPNTIFNNQQASMCMSGCGAVSGVYIHTNKFRTNNDYLQK